MAKAKAKILKGTLERIGPGQREGDGALHDYIDIGGQRVNRIGWTDVLGYRIENAVGREVRLALHNSSFVAAVEIDGVVTKEKQKAPLNIAAIFLASLCLGIGGAIIAGIMMFASFEPGAGPRFSWMPVLLSQLPVVFLVLYSVGNRAALEAAKTALD